MAKVFNDTEKKLLRESWDLVKNKPVEAMVEFFYQFFTDHPDYKNFFPVIKDVNNNEQLRNLPELKKHAGWVKNRISRLIDLLENEEALVKDLQMLGESHNKKQVGKQQFNDLKITLISFLKKQFPNEMTTNHEYAWDKFLETGFTVIFPKLDQ